MAFDRARFLTRFVEEAREHLQLLNDGLLLLEKGESPPDQIHSIFRSAHTIKGGARMMKLTAIGEMAHRMEDVLDAIRGGRITARADTIEMLFRGLDELTRMIEGVARGDESEHGDVQLAAMLAKAAESALPAGAAEEPVEARPAVVAPAQAAPSSRTAAPVPRESLRVSTSKLDEMVRLVGELTALQNRMHHRLVEVRGIDRSARALQEEMHRRPEGTDGNGNRGDLEGEMLSILSSVRGMISLWKDTVSFQDLLTADLQNVTLRLRMLPLATIFETFNRSVRDLAKSLGKEINFDVSGGEVELDKALIEKLSDPLLHMLRNAIDHGIESPADRAAAGKPRQGSVQLRAEYLGNSVAITVADDGGGIPVQRLRAKAVEKGILDAEAAAALSEREAMELIFHPGLSTSSIITDLSGRGVGMDVVRKNIVEDLRGTIQIESSENHGTTFIMRLPMTLAIVELLLVEIGGRRYAVPARHVREVRRLRSEEIVKVMDRMAFPFGSDLVPLITLDALLNRKPADSGSASELLVLQLESGGERLGLVVQALLEESAMVVKSLPACLDNSRLISGVTVSGDDMLVPILNIANLGGAVREMRGERVSAAARPEEPRTVRILVVDDSIHTREIEKSILESYGYEVDVADNGLDALERIHENQFDLVVTDIEMPLLDGFELTERLRQDPGFRDRPVIIVSSRSSEEDRRRGVAAGANAYIAKGDFEQSTLLETIQSLAG